MIGRSIITGATALALCASAAIAAVPAWMEPAFGNTVVTTYPSGKSTKLWIDRSGGFELLRSTGKRHYGRWTVKGERICFKQTKPIALPISHCQARIAGGIGSRWPGKSIGGESVTNVLVAGQAGR
ncbi:MAG TPA: hypothetical protein VF559_09720 [Caulobacteraceae bacterium]